MLFSRKPKYAYPSPDDTLKKVLPNGITVLVRENFASPAVIVNGYLEAGGEDVPTELRGLAGFTTDVMERGTQRRTFEQLYEEVESIGAVFGVGVGSHITSFGAKGLAEYLPLLLDIISDTLRTPAFPSEHVEKTRAEILTDLQEREHNTRRMASLNFYQLAYPKTHPYHWSLSGYNDTIKRITRDDLVNFHKTYFTPQGMTIVVVGAIKAEKALKAIEEVFGNWQASRPPRETLLTPPKLTSRLDKRVSIADKTQSELILGWPGPSRLNPDFIPAYIANNILGIFGMYGRLGKNVREKHGLAYHVYSIIDGGTGPGPWRVIAGVNPANVDKAVGLIVQELERIRDELVSEEELSNTQSYLTGSLPLQLETNEGVAQSLINIERYKLGLNYLQNYNDMIISVTREQIREAAQRWLDPENFALAVAGPEADAEA